MRSIGQQQLLHYDRDRPAPWATGALDRGKTMTTDRLETNHWGSSMFRQAWRTRNTRRFFFSWFLIVPFRAPWASSCTSRLSSSAPQSRGLCGCTPACSRWTVLRLLSLQGSLGLDHTAGTAKQVQCKLVQIQQHIIDTTCSQKSSKDGSVWILNSITIT